MRRGTCPILLLGFVLVAAVVMAQARNGRLQGLVQDESGAFVPGATITLTNVETKAVQRTLSVRTGEYGFEAPGGVYELKAELPGFETVIMPRVQLTENQTVRMDLMLSLARRGQPRQ